MRIMRLSFALFLALFFCCLSEAAVPQNVQNISLEELRMEKRFGFGFSAAGPLSLLGIEFDFNVTPEVSIGGGMGTGLDYSTMMVKGRYFLLGKTVSPYIGVGLARWWSQGTNEKNLSPSILQKKFLKPGSDLSDGFNVFLVYPVIGVQLMQPNGLSVFAEVQYLIKLLTLANGAYAGLGMHWYF